MFGGAIINRHKRIYAKESNFREGFTLIEVLLVVGIIAILAAIVIIAINPNKQLADAHNAQRRSDIQTIQKAVYLYNIDTGQLPTVIPAVSTEICKEAAASCTGLVNLSALTQNQKYLIAIPTDPKATNPNGSGYFIIRDSTTGRIFLDAVFAENAVTISTNPANTPPPSDTTPPSVAITSPTAGSTVSGNMNITTTSSDNVGVAGIQFKLDGNNLGAEDTTIPFAFAWNTIVTPNGAHTLTATARDAAGNQATSPPITVTVNNDTTPPTVSIASPTNGSTVTGTVAVNATATDNIGVVGVQFKLDGVNLGAEDTVSPYSVSWNTTTTTNGSHILTATARDAAGNTTTASNITVTVNNQATSLNINMAAAALTNANRSLTGITVQNTGTSAIVIDKITVSWTNAARRITQIQIGGATVWSGSQTSGTLLDITNRTLNVGAAATPINRFLFNSSMLGNTITITFTMLDGTTKTISKAF